MARLTAHLTSERCLRRVYRKAYPARPAILASSIGSGSGERTPESPEQHHRCRRPSYHHTPGGALAAAAGPVTIMATVSRRPRPSSRLPPPTQRCRHQARHQGEQQPGRPHIGGACQWGQKGHRNGGLGNSKMVQCKKQIRFHQQE